MRSIADQDVAELGGRASVLVRQKRDHVRLDGLLEELEAVRGGDGEEQVLRRIYRLVFPHAYAEEVVLWPVMRRVLHDGHELTLQVEQEHQEVNELVRSLERSRPGDPGRDGVLDRLVLVLREDVRDEEDVLLARLQQALSPRELRRLGVAWEAVRRTAPTRAHPTVSRRPPGNVLSAVPLTVLDRSRDVVDAAARRVPRQAAPVLRGAGTGLAFAARGVERIPPFRVGEDSSTHRRGTEAS